MNLEPYYENASRRRLRQKRNKKYVGIGVLLFIFAVSLFVTGYERKELVKCHGPGLSVEQLRYQAYFHKAGNKHSEVMANAVLATKQPKLMAAVAVKGELNTPYTVRKGGYKKRHAGAWQQSEKDWGKVPYDALNQAIKAEKDLAGLIVENGNLEVALNKWGGDKTKKIYAKNILNELTNIP
jgi:hypothetical protein